MIDAFGIQLSSRDHIGKESKDFFEFDEIKDAVINEAIKMVGLSWYTFAMVNYTLLMMPYFT